VFVFTTNLRSQSILASLSAEGAFGDAERVNAVCQQQFVDSGHLSELVGRFRQIHRLKALDESAFAAISLACIVKLGREYGMEVVECDSSVSAAILRRERQRGLGARPIHAITKPPVVAGLYGSPGPRITGKVRVLEAAGRLEVFPIDSE